MSDDHLLVCSGQFRLRIPKALHAALTREARRQGISMNSYVLYLLSSRHSYNVAWREATDHYVHRFQHTLRVVRDMVSSVTLGEPEPQEFRWRSTGRSRLIAEQADFPTDPC